MFTKAGLRDMDQWCHQRLSVLLEHMDSVPPALLHEVLANFGIPTVWKQIVHILDVESQWVNVLQGRARAASLEKNCATKADLLCAKQQVQNATRAYLESLNETELNTPLAKKPKDWVGELKTPA